MANDILMQSFGAEDTYDPMVVAEDTESDSDESDDDTSANGFVINVSDIKHHITPDEFEDADTDDDFDTPANVDDFLNDDDDEDDDESDGHSRHSRFRGFFKINFEVFMIQAITLLVIAALVAIDQVIKIAVVNRFAAGGSMDILFGLIRIRYVENTGAAFSSMQNQTVFLTIFTAVVIVMFIFLLMTKK